MKSLNKQRKVRHFDKVTLEREPIGEKEAVVARPGEGYFGSTGQHKHRL